MVFPHRESDLFFSSLGVYSARGEGMTIYLDQVFALNTLVNFFLLRLCGALTQGGGGRLRHLAAATGGGLYAALVPVWPPLGALPIRIIAFAGLCAAAFGPRRWRSWLWFFGVCCAFGGLTLAVTGWMGQPVLYLGGRVYYPVTGRLLALLSGGLYALGRGLLFCFARHRGRQLVRLELEIGGKKAAYTALVDTGNTLRDPISGESALVLWAKAAQQLLPGLPQTEAEAQLLWLQAHYPGLRPRLLPYRAVGTGAGLLCALRPDAVRQNGKPCPARLAALSPTPLSDGGEYQALLQQE